PGLSEVEGQLPTPKSPWGWESTRERPTMLETLWQDLRYGVRSLRRSPAFTAAAALTLALGVGANSAIFALVDAALLHPLPFAQPDRLVMLWESSKSDTRGAWRLST